MASKKKKKSRKQVAKNNNFKKIDFKENAEEVEKELTEKNINKNENKLEKNSKRTKEKLKSEKQKNKNSKEMEKEKQQNNNKTKNNCEENIKKKQEESKKDIKENTEKKQKNKNEKKAEKRQEDSKEVKSEDKELEEKLEKIDNLIQNKNEVNESIKSKKKKWFGVILIFIILLVFTVFSTIFALFNINNEKIVKGIKIKDIDVSGLTIEEAKNKIEKAINIELMLELKLKYKDKYETNFDTSQIEFVYNIDKAINNAYQYGRDGNIIENNYKLLYAVFVGKNIDIEYTYNTDFFDNFVTDLESKIPGVVTQASYYIEENQLIINKGTDGLGIDFDKFKNEIIDNIYNRNAENIINNNKDEVLEISTVSKKAEKIDIERIYEEIYTEPKDAYYELEPFNIYPEVNGVDLEIGVEEAKKQIDSEEKEEYVFNLKITPPEKTIKSFGIEAFPKIVSSFSTKYDARNINRSKNLEIAAGKIDGIVLLPGEVFSFNKVVGKRTVEEGYRDAKIYADGQVVDGLAGGICQISSTLYNAVLLANLEIVERRNHSFTTTYVPAGRDATVVYGTTDFQFKNTRSFPIKIEATVSKGIATFNIHSVSLEENEYEVKIIPQITQSIPYAVEYIQDPTLIPGQQVIVQAGHAGYRVTTYKELLQNGISVLKDVLSNDVYKPMKSIIRIGP